MHCQLVRTPPPLSSRCGGALQTRQEMGPQSQPFSSAEALQKISANWRTIGLRRRAHGLAGNRCRSNRRYVRSAPESPLPPLLPPLPLHCMRHKWPCRARLRSLSIECSGELFWGKYLRIVAQGARRLRNEHRARQCRIVRDGTVVRPLTTHPHLSYPKSQ